MANRQLTYQMTDKEFLQSTYNFICNECDWHETHLLRFKNIIDNMPDKGKLLEGTLKRVDKLCEERNVKQFAEGTTYKTDSLLAGDLLFSPSIKASNV